MFDKEQLDRLFDDLKTELGNLSEWGQLVKDAHLGVARSDANVSLGDIDARVATIIERFRESG